MDAFSSRWAAEMLLLPPGGTLLLALLGLLIGWRRRRSTLGTAFVVLGLLGTWGFATPLVSSVLCRQVEGEGVRAPPEEFWRGVARGPGAPGAIVVLGGGTRRSTRDGPEHHFPNARTMERLAHGAALARLTGLPLLAAGGSAPTRNESEALIMSRALERSFGLKTRWREERSKDTAGNARETAALLRDSGVRKIVLVTHAYHMRRAKAAFEAAGLEVIAAPHGFLSGGEAGPLDLVPSGRALDHSWLALHETIGWYWYRWNNDI